MNKSDVKMLALVVLICAAIMLWMPRSAPDACVGPIEILFGNCTR